MTRGSRTALGALAVALTLMPARSRAEERPAELPLRVLPVRDARGQEDAELSRALRVALRLGAHPDSDGGVLGEGAGSCEAGCRQIEVVGARGTEPRYAIRLRILPVGPRSEVALSAPPGISPFLLAEAIVVKIAFLVRRAERSADPVPHALRAELTPAAAPPGKPAAETFVLGAGPAFVAGLDGDFTTFGADIGLTWRVKGKFALRATLGWQDFGSRSGEHHRLTYRGLPVSLQAGFRFAPGRWRFYGFGGASLLSLWVDLGDYDVSDIARVVVGATLEGRVEYRLWDDLGLGLSLRPGYLFGRVAATAPKHGEIFRLPRVLLSGALDLAYSF